MSLFARIFTRQNIVAIAVGVLVAVSPLVAFNFWLSGVVDRQGQEEAEVSARRAVSIVEQRVGQVVATLDRLVASGVAECNPAALLAMQRATFDTAPIKEIAILDPAGRTVCTHLSHPALAVDAAPGQRRILSSEPLGYEPRYSLDVVSVAGGVRMVRLRRSLGREAGELAALVPAGQFMPQLSAEIFENLFPETTGQISAAREASGAYVLVETRGRTTIGELGQRPRNADEGMFVASQRSGKYGVTAEVMTPRGRAVNGQTDLKWLGLFVTGVIVALLGFLARMIGQRSPHNPVAEIERALADGEFIPYYQPIVDISTGQLRGAEVLVRWKKPDGTLVLPGAFIPLAESSGLIRAMTYDLMQRASDEVGAAIGQRLGLKVAFNFASKLFSDDLIVKDICDIFARSPIKLSQLVLELTERDPIENFTVTRQIVAAMQGLGVRIAIDDVGTGHSGLSYMLKLGVDIIKIDKMFVDALGTDRNSTTIVETLVDLAHNMRMDVVAEGVENFEQVMHLRELGIRAAQGYVFAPPLPGSAFLKLVDAMDKLSETHPAQQTAAA